MTAFKERFVDAAGIRMRMRMVGEQFPGTPALLLHGFTGCIETVQRLAEYLATDRPVIAVDLVGHGDSDAPDDPARYSMAECVEQVVSALEGRSVHVVGYSMGGRVALSLALAHPTRVLSLVLIGASAGLADSEARAVRIAADEALARRIEEGGLAKFVDHWMSLPLFSSQASLGADFLAASRAQRLRCNVRGLTNSLRGMGTGSMPALHARLREIVQPVCLVAGSRDAKFVGVAQELCGQLPNAHCELIEGVGHAAHLEDSTRFAQITRTFLWQIEQR